MPTRMQYKASSPSGTSTLAGCTDSIAEASHYSGTTGILWPLQGPLLWKCVYIKIALYMKIPFPLDTWFNEGPNKTSLGRYFAPGILPRRLWILLGTPYFGIMPTQDISAELPRTSTLVLFPRKSIDMYIYFPLETPKLVRGPNEVSLCKYDAPGIYRIRVRTLSGTP